MSEMKATGFPNLGMEDLVKARIFKIDADYVRQVREMGFDKEDFEGLAKAIDPYIEKAGGLAAVVVEAPKFPAWDSFGALAAHLRFVRDHHKRIRKLLTELEGISLDITENDPRRNRRPRT